LSATATARGARIDQLLDVPERRHSYCAPLSEANRTLTKHDEANGERRERIRPANAELRRCGKPDKAKERQECTDGGKEAVGAECTTTETKSNSSLQECERRLHDE